MAFKKSSIVKSIIAATAAVIAAVCLITKTEQIQQAVALSTDVCLNTLLPSLCGFMILSSFLINSGIFRVVLLPVKRVLEDKLKLTTELTAAIILSQIGGYPVGVKLCNDLISYNKNYNEICRKLSPFMYASGPAFLTGIAGAIVYKDINAGMIIFISCVIANIAAALPVILRQKNALCCKTPEYVDFSSDTVVKSVKSSFMALAIISMFVITFNLISELVLSFFPSDILANNIVTYVKCIWEISNIRLLKSDTPLFITTAFCSFGGICVILQTKALAKFNLNIIRFIFIRIFVSISSSLICLTIEKLIGYEYLVTADNIHYYYNYKIEPLVLACFIAMTVILLHTTDKIYKKNKKICKKG